MHIFDALGRFLLVIKFLAGEREKLLFRPSMTLPEIGEAAGNATTFVPNRLFFQTLLIYEVKSHGDFYRPGLR